MNPLDQLTVIVPTYRRHGYLDRSIEYWRQIKTNIIIVDSTSERYAGEIPANFRYKHEPGGHLYEKIANVIEDVRTKYIVVCADDDFLIQNGLIECIRWLNTHPSYSSAQGRYIAFWVKENREVDYTIRYASQRNFHVDHRHSGPRMIQAMTPYMHQIYSVTRTRNALVAFRISASIATEDRVEQMNIAELNIALVNSIFGNHITLPVFYGAREAAASGRGLWTFEECLKNIDNEGKVSQWRNDINNALSKTLQDNPDLKEQRQASFDDAIEALVGFANGTFSRSILVSISKFVIPRKVRRQLIRRWKNSKNGKPFSSWPPTEESARVLRNKFSKEEGYPLSSQANEDYWQSISSLITKYDNLY